MQVSIKYSANKNKREEKGTSAKSKLINASYIRHMTQCARSIV